MHIAITLAPILFMLCAAVSVVLMNRAQRELTAEQKVAVFDAAPKSQASLLVAMALLMGAFALASMYGRPNRWLFAAFAIAVFSLLVAHTASYIRRLSRSAAPPAYVGAVRRGMWIMWIAGFLMFATLTVGTWRWLPR